MRPAARRHGRSLIVRPLLSCSQTPRRRTTAVSNSIFLDFSLPNSTTWFYFSALLAAAYFFNFRRFFSLRNWDLVALFVLVPGLLIVQEGHNHHRAERALNHAADCLVAKPDLAGPPSAVAAALRREATREQQQMDDRLYWGYAWLLAGSGYWCLRCLVDLAVPRRPILTTNLNLAGLTWLSVMLFVSLGIVSLRRTVPEVAPVGPTNTVIVLAQARATEIVQAQAGVADGESVRWAVQRSLAGACHLLVIVALVLIGRVHWGDWLVGTACATAYLLLPYIAFHITQIHHVLPTAFLLWAVLAYRRPRLAGAFVGIAAGGFVFPLLAVPAWASFYKGRGMSRFLSSFGIAAGISLALAGLVLYLNGLFDWKIPTTISLPAWRNWRVPNAEGFWTGVHWAYRIPVFIVALTFVATTAVWPNPKDLAQIIALTAAHLTAAQLWYAQSGGVYVLWYLPLLLLLVFRPSTGELRPPEIDAKAEVDTSLNGQAQRSGLRPTQSTTG